MALEVRDKKNNLDNGWRVAQWQRHRPCFKNNISKLAAVPVAIP